MARPVTVLACIAVIAALAGCAERPSADPTTTPTPSASTSGKPSPSPTGLPTLKPPTAPPKSPTDALPTDRLAGRVTKGGSGPCYGLITDDGKEYALYSTAGVTLTEGSYVIVHTAPLLIKFYCGPGERRSMVKVEPVR